MSIWRTAPVGLAFAVLASLLIPAPATALISSGTATSVRGERCADPLVAAPVGGAAAVAELGSDLPEAAANIDRSPSAYRALLRSDPTLRVDECGETFVIEPKPTHAQRGAGAEADETASATDAPVTAEGLDSSADAFLLNSRPGSDRTILLDFDGQQVVGTGWNTDHSDVFAAPFDTDGSSGTFSTAERDVIRSVWLRVAEDYAPFDINVTTQDTGPAAIARSSSDDLQYGTRALITMDSVLWADQCGSGCGGVAYVGVFDDAGRHDYYQPALVFQRGLGGVGTNAKLIAEAASHEVGHNLGLQHDGKTGTGATGYYAGQGAWAPIMGVGYNRPVAQWSRGEYAGADNAEDDLAVMVANGATRMTDDHPDTATGATLLGYFGPAVDGLIATRTDTDWFSFTVPADAASTAVRVTPQAVSGDLDASVTVYDAAGAQVGTADPAVAMSNSDLATGLATTLTLPLAPGTYTAKVDGVGWGNPATSGYSDYASLGRYTISAGDSLAPTPGTPQTPVSDPPTTSTPTALPPAAPATPIATASNPAPSATWTGSLRAAVNALTVRRETTAGFATSRFPIVDADRDCRSTRVEVLAAETRGPVGWTSARHCAIRSGRWFSLFDRRSVTRASNVAAVWTVPLAEAWQSGARSWTAKRRQTYANDLADSRTLLAVTNHSAKARANREPQRWLPAPKSRCAYVAQWVAVKLRWGLTVNSAERSRLASLAAACGSTRVAVRRA